MLSPRCSAVFPTLRPKNKVVVRRISGVQLGLVTSRQSRITLPAADLLMRPIRLADVCCCSLRLATEGLRYAGFYCKREPTPDLLMALAPYTGLRALGTLQL